MSTAADRELESALEFLDVLRRDGASDLGVLHRFDALYGEIVRDALSKWAQILHQRGRPLTQPQRDTLYGMARTAALAQLQHQDDQLTGIRKHAAWQRLLTEKHQGAIQTLARRISMVVDVALRSQLG